MELLCHSVSVVTPGAFRYHQGYKDFTQIWYLEPRLLPRNAGPRRAVRPLHEHVKLEFPKIKEATGFWHITLSPVARQLIL